MFGIMGRVSLGLVTLFILSLPVKSDVQTLHLCKEGDVTSERVDLNMDTSLIAGTQGSCYCAVIFQHFTEFDLIFQNIISPSCDTVIEIQDPTFNATCPYNSQQTHNTKNFNVGPWLWIFVKTLGNSLQPMSGTIEMRTKNNVSFNLKCIKSNVASTIPASEVVTSTLTTNKHSSSVLTETTDDDKASQSNHVNTGVTREELPVALIFGCWFGGFALVGLILVAVVIYRRKKANRNPDHSTSPKTSLDHTITPSWDVYAVVEKIK